VKTRPHLPLYTHTHVYNYTVYIFGVFWFVACLLGCIVRVVLSLILFVTFLL
jgi:hypothetical protein